MKISPNIGDTILSKERSFWIIYSFFKNGSLFIFSIHWFFLAFWQGLNYSGNPCHWAKTTWRNQCWSSAPVSNDLSSQDPKEQAPGGVEKGKGFFPPEPWASSQGEKWLYGNKRICVYMDIYIYMKPNVWLETATNRLGLHGMIRSRSGFYTNIQLGRLHCLFSGEPQQNQWKVNLG